MNFYRIYELLDESRKNPELNPKVSIVDALEPYSNNIDYYISFTDINKIGVNPKSKFDTPIGIYCYPLNKIYKSLVNDTIPYASDRPFVQLIKAKKKMTILNINYFGISDFEKNINKLKKLYPGYVEIIDELKELSEYDSKVPNPGGFFWNITWRLSTRLSYRNNKKAPIVWNKILRNLGHNGFVDYGDGIIHKNEPIQAVFMTKDSFEHVGTFLNKRYNGKDKNFINVKSFINVNEKNAAINTDIKIIKNSNFKNSKLGIIEKIVDSKFNKSEINKIGLCFNSDFDESIIYKLENFNILGDTFRGNKIFQISNGFFKLLYFNSNLFDIISNVAFFDCTVVDNNFNLQDKIKFEKCILQENNFKNSNNLNIGSTNIIENSKITSSNIYNSMIQGGKFISCTLVNCILIYGDFDNCNIVDCKYSNDLNNLEDKNKLNNSEEFDEEDKNKIIDNFKMKYKIP